MSSRTQRPAAPPPAAPPKSTRKAANPKVAQGSTGASTGKAEAGKAEAGKAEAGKAEASKAEASKAQAKKPAKAQASTTAKAEASTASGEGTNSAFLYGTLMMPELFYKTLYGTTNPPESTRKLHTFQPASLDGYQRFCVKAVEYPGIIPARNRKVYGTFVSGLTKAHLQKMDKYEGGQYDRKPLTVNLLKRLGGGEVADAGKAVGDVYIFKFPHELEVTDWDPVEFRRLYQSRW
ncbi:hypothetical protein B0I37DRAFT_445514 [Chaetomium sp. MPI-CAGE-AT-0009]|nr:hypothetical protein B0I37DRAFT_445514 [Chaetomium sp. MPI-CAGE-AT-0009]